MLTVWGRRNSHNVKKVMWLVREIGLEHVRHDIGGAYGMTDAYRALNPNALVPTIEDDGVVLWESNAILRYLAAAHAADRFWPSDPAARAQADKWMDWHFTYAAAQHTAFWHLIRRTPEDRDAAAIEASVTKTGALMAVLDDALSRQRWLSGEQFGIGDIPMGVYAHTWFALDIARPSRPHVEDWYARLQERPGYTEEVMIPLT